MVGTYLICRQSVLVEQHISNSTFLYYKNNFAYFATRLFLLFQEHFLACLLMLIRVLPTAKHHSY